MTKDSQQHIHFHAMYAEQYSTDTSITFYPGGPSVIRLEKCHLQEFSDSITTMLSTFHVIKKSTTYIKCTATFHSHFVP